MKKPTILVAEDDASLLQSIRIRLGSEGYQVLCASDGYQAVALAREHRPDLLILDVNMPAGDGFSVQERVVKMDAQRRTPIVYITGERSQHLHDMVRSLGIRWLLRKPFDTEELLQTVQDALEQSECHDESMAPASR
jgi:DNA-binding response OmpR family regulator